MQDTLTVKQSMRSDDHLRTTSDTRTTYWKPQP